MPVMLCSCKLKTENFKNYMWKYSDGLYLGDVFYLDNKKCKNDTIYVDSIPKYVIKTSKGYFGLPTELFITDIKTYKTGRYIGK